MQLTKAVKLIPAQQHRRRYLSVETANARFFSTIKRKKKFLSADGRASKFVPSRKPQTQ